MPSDFDFANKKYTIPLIVAALVWVGAALRLWHLDFAPLTIDEAWTIYLVKQAWWQIPFLDVHPPLFFWVEQILLAPTAINSAVVTVANLSEAAVRAGALAFGVVAIPLTWWFGKELTGYDLPGIIGAMFMAVSIFAIQQSQQARMYTLVLVLFLLFLIFYIRAIRGDEQEWYAVAIFGVLLVWTHYFMLIPLAITIGFTLYVKHFQLSRRMVLSGMVALLGLIPLAIPALGAISLKSMENNEMPYIGLDLLKQTLLSLTGADLLYGGILLVIALVGGLFLAQKFDHGMDYVTVLTIGSLISGVVLSYLLMFVPRYFIFLQPIFYVLIGQGLVGAWAYARAATGSRLYADIFWFIVLLSTVAVFLMPIPLYYNTPPADNWSQHDSSMRSIMRQGETQAILANPGALTQWSYYYPSQVVQNVTIVPFYNLEMLQGVVMDFDYTGDWMVFNPGETLPVPQESYVTHRSVVAIVPSVQPSDSGEPEKILNYLQSNGQLVVSSYRGGWDIYRITSTGGT